MASNHTSSSAPCWPLVDATGKALLCLHNPPEIGFRREGASVLTYIQGSTGGVVSCKDAHSDPPRSPERPRGYFSVQPTSNSSKPIPGLFAGKRPFPRETRDSHRSLRGLSALLILCGNYILTPYVHAQTDLIPPGPRKSSSHPSA